LTKIEQVLERFTEELDALGFATSTAHRDERRPIPSRLPERQQQVLGLLLSGLDIDEIAATLYLSPHTIRNHKKAAFRALGIRSRVELFARYRLH
jgi:two-component system response regulator DesR